MSKDCFDYSNFTRTNIYTSPRPNPCCCCCRGPQGPQGEQGPPGAAILDSYDTLAELIAAHPVGNRGDAYLVAGELYVWNVDTASWQNVGSLVGPQGEKGDTGSVGTILGSYDTLAALIAAHPTGNQGDAYLVDGTLYVWDTGLNEWRAVGSLRAPAPESRTIIPFASQIAPLTTAVAGIPTRVSLLGFGTGDGRGNLTNLDDYSLRIDTSDGHFDLDADGNSDNLQMVFSLPFNMTLKSIAATCGTWGEYTFTHTVFPYVQVYAAEPASNSFRVISSAVAIPEEGIGPGLTQRGTLRYTLTENLNVSLPAGTRIAIGALMRTSATGTAETEGYWLYFTGALGLAYENGD